MAINSINTVTAAAAASTQTTTKTAEKTSETTKKASSSKTASGVIYEKSSDSRTDKASNKTTSKADNAAIVAKLKADAEQRTAQLRSIVEQMMTKQGVAIGTADDMWKFLAKGDFTVSADVKAQAQADSEKDTMSEITVVDMEQMVGSVASYTVELSGTTKQIYNCLDWITENDEKMSVGDVNIQFDKSTGKLSGTIVVNFYAMLGNGVAYKEPDTTGFAYGVNNVFGAVK